MFKNFSSLRGSNIWAQNKYTSLPNLHFNIKLSCFCRTSPFSSSFLLSLPHTLHGGLACGREPRPAEVSGVSGGQVWGAMAAEQRPDPVLSINLNPDLPGPELANLCLASVLIALKMTLHLKVPLCKHPTGTDSHQNYHTVLVFEESRKSLSLWEDFANSFNCCAKQCSSLF